MLTGNQLWSAIEYQGTTYIQIAKQMTDVYKIKQYICKHLNNSQVGNHYCEWKSSLQTFTKWVMYDQIVLVDT